MYESFFGLTAKPFQLNPDPDFFFGSRGHRRAMAYLEYGLHQGEGFIVVTGEVGAGKTTLVRSLLRRIPAQTISAAQIVSTQVGADDLLRLVASGFGIPHEGLEKSALLARLEEHFRYLHADGRRALLVVDEAQNLSSNAVEELRMLSNFQIGSRSLVQSFLVGQPQFREIMQRPSMQQLRQRIIASYHLGPLDAAETQAYIEHRLTHVGWRGDPSFDTSAYERIFESTGGVPRRINTLCDRLLLAAYLSTEHALTSVVVDEVAHELSEELGPSKFAPPLGTAPHARGSERLSGEPNESPLRLPDASDRLSQLEDRVSLLEASGSMTYGMLKKVLRALRAAQSAEKGVS